MRRTVLIWVASTPLWLGGCAMTTTPSTGSSSTSTSTSPSDVDAFAKYREGPKVRPDARAWRRKPVPLPPLYASFTSGSGDRWKVITPLYWQIDGHDRSRRLLFPLMHYAEDRPARRTSGYVLNWFWGNDDDGGHRVFFPLYWNFRSPAADTSLWGPLYVRREHDAEQRRRLLVFPWIFSREVDASGYDYWGVIFRLVGYEKQVIEGEQRERLWLFFVVPIRTV